MKENKKEKILNIERQVRSLYYEMDCLEEEVESIFQEAYSVFDDKNEFENRFEKFRGIKNSKSVHDFETSKLIFCNDLLFLQTMEKAKNFQEELENVDYIKLKTEKNNKVFIVHGHNDKIKNEVSDFIKSIGLIPIILHEQPNIGRTIIKKFEEESEVDFAIVILSADDLGRSKINNESNNKLRARQNVIFELGYFIGKIGRRNVIALMETDVEFDVPSDYNGVVYEIFDKNNHWKERVKRELHISGFELGNAT